MLVSSHVLHEVQSLTPQIVLLNRGRLVAEGHVREIRDLIDKHPHRIVLVCDKYRALAAKLAGCDDVDGIKFLDRESGLHGRDAAAGRLLRPPAGAGPGRRAGRPRGVLRRRQPGSRVQVPGEPMTATEAPPSAPAVRPPSCRRSAALFALTVRQHTHGRRLLVLGAAVPAAVRAGGPAADPAAPGPGGRAGVRPRLHAPAARAGPAHGAAVRRRHGVGRGRGADADVPAAAVGAAVGAVPHEVARDAVRDDGAGRGRRCWRCTSAIYAGTPEFWSEVLPRAGRRDRA